MDLKTILKFSFALLIAFSLSNCSSESSSESNELSKSETVNNEPKNQFVQNEVLLKVSATGADYRPAVERLLKEIDGKVVETIATKAMNPDLRSGTKNEILLVNTKIGTLGAIAKIKNDADVEYVEPNWLYSHFATSNDTYFTNGSLWGMSANNNLNGSRAATAWANNKIGSNTVYIGIIDEGYMHTHEDLAANAGVNPGEVAGNGVDDDNNGYVDDVYGFDFAGNDNSVFDGLDDDHGTHVAGTIGGVGGNGIGVAGVCWNIKLLGGKFLGKRSGSTANAIKAIDYFTDLKSRHGLNIVATNNSWGGGGFSQALKDAIDRANTAGILFIAAAGNSGTNNDVTASYPSNYTSANVIAVASITSTGGLSSFSQYGATTVDLGAPGSGIWSTVPKRVSGAVVSSYASYNGTSMATPHVSGAAALYASINPGANAATIKNAILSSVTPTTSLTGKCVTGGRLNVSGF